MATLRDLTTLRRAAASIQADLAAATGEAWAIDVTGAIDATGAMDATDELLVSVTRGDQTVRQGISPALDEDDWEWDDLDAEILPTTLWHDAAEAVWDVVDAAFYCWAAGIPACPRPGGGPLLLVSGKWTCRAHAHDVAAVGELASAPGS